jgi:hypothetical protein
MIPDRNYHGPDVNTHTRIHKRVRTCTHREEIAMGVRGELVGGLRPVVEAGIEVAGLEVGDSTGVLAETVVPEVGRIDGAPALVVAGPWALIVLARPDAYGVVSKGGATMRMPAQACYRGSWRRGIPSWW